MRPDLISVRPLRPTDPGRPITVWLVGTRRPQIPVPPDFDVTEISKSVADLAWDVVEKAAVSPHASTAMAPPHILQQAQAAPGSPDVSSPGHQLARARGIMQVAHNKFQEHNHSIESGHPVGPRPDATRAQYFAHKYHEAKAHVDHYERQGVADTPEHHSDWEMHHMMNPTPGEGQEGGHWKDPGSISMRQAHSTFQMTGQAQPGYGGLSASPKQVEQMRIAAQQPQAQRVPAPGQSPEPTPTPSRAQVMVPGGKPIGPEAQTGMFKRSMELLDSMVDLSLGKSLQIIEEMLA